MGSPPDANDIDRKTSAQRGIAASSNDGTTDISPPTDKSSHALDELAVLGHVLRAGSICTITAMPVRGRAAPRVVIPDVDRRAETPETFLELLVPLYHGDGSSEEMASRWDAVFEDCCPHR